MRKLRKNLWKYVPHVDAGGGETILTRLQHAGNLEWRWDVSIGAKNKNKTTESHAKKYWKAAHIKCARPTANVLVMPMQGKYARIGGILQHGKCGKTRKNRVCQGEKSRECWCKRHCLQATNGGRCEEKISCKGGHCTLEDRKKCNH